MGNVSFLRIINTGDHRVYLRSGILILFEIVVCLLFAPLAALAAEGSIENDIQKGLAQSKAIAATIQVKLQSGSSNSSELSRLKTIAGDIRVSNLLMEERFKTREDMAKPLGSKALGRHRVMAEGYRKALTEYLSLIDSLPSDGSVPQSTIQKLQSLLEKILPKRNRHIIGSLPYKHLNYPTREPNSAAAMTPAYQGGNKTVSPDDTAGTLEAPISKEIASLAQSLNWNPVSIYEYVKNNIETEWYFGCMKGAEETLRQKSGNDCDQAALLAALLRASGFPTRYVRGAIEFFPDLERLKNLTGIDDPAKIAEFFQKSGIPFKPIIAGGKIANFQIEHVWVESRIPYANYRGVVIDENGKAWFGLDTSIKVKGYTYSNAQDLLQESGVSSQLSGIRDEYLGLASSGTGSTPFELNQTPLEYLKTAIERQSAILNPQSAIRYEDYLRSRTLIPEVLNIIPASPQFKLIAVTNEYTSIPQDLKHTVRLTAAGGGNQLFDITLDTLKLSNQRIAISYEPETVEDQETIDAWGGMDNTPAYLVRLRPVLLLNGDRITVGKEGLPMGSEYSLTIELTGATGADNRTEQRVERMINTQIVGNLSVIGIVAQRAISNQQQADSSTPNAESLLFQEAIRYIDRWNQAEDELSSLFHLSITRPFPTVVTLGNVIDVSYLLDMPHEFTWKGVYVDASLRAVEAVNRTLNLNPDDRTLMFMQLSSLQGSVLEHRILEDDFQVDSISTAKLIQIISQGTGSTRLGSGLVTIDSANIGEILPTLVVDDVIKEDITNAVNQNCTIRIPRDLLTGLSEIVYHDWTGTGYIKENLATGEAGWMLSGMIAGSMSNLSPEQWVNLYLLDTLGHPFTGKPNSDGMAGAKITKISATDLQPAATVGTVLSKPFSVLVTDAKGIPIEGATVTFTILAGGGKITCKGGGTSDKACEAKTKFTGIAKASLTLGEKTGASPYYEKLDSADTYYTQVGRNLVTASVTGRSGELSIPEPFTGFGKPDKPVKMMKKFPMEEEVAVPPDNPGGSLLVLVLDSHDNPVSNVQVHFKAKDASPVGSAAGGFKNLRFYKSQDCKNNPYPLADDCTMYEGKIEDIETEYTGARVETMVGNATNTVYSAEATIPAFLKITPIAFRFSTKAFIAGEGIYQPPTLLIQHLSHAGQNSQAVFVGKAGAPLKIPLTAELLLLEVIERPVTPTVQDSLGRVYGDIEPPYYIKTRKITNGNVTFTTKSGGGSSSPTENPGNGQYLTTFTTGTIPGLNVLEATGKAEVTVPEIWDENCPDSADSEINVTCCNPKGIRIPGGEMGRQYTTKDFKPMTFEMLTGSCLRYSTNIHEPFLHYWAWERFNLTDFTWDYAPYEKSTTYNVYGVDAKILTLDPKIVMLDENGFSSLDSHLTYSILPTGYQARDVSVNIYEGSAGSANSDNDAWLFAVQGSSLENSGTVTLFRGTTFDPNKEYYAQVIINLGSDEEVKGEKVPLRVAALKVFSDKDTNPIEEIKFGKGDSGKPEKIYRIELKSKSMVKDCLNLAGAITVVDKDGQKINEPPATENSDPYASEYQLRFTVENSTCIARIKDTLDSGNLKEKFMLSNRSRKDLSLDANANLTGKAVLYGGIGNTVRVEISGIRQEMPVEPVGVIVLGIDGLRQDVLYPDVMDGKAFENVDEPVEDYYVDARTLPGLGQILRGDPENSEKQSYVMLPKVTAIFPSITFASWASIFTGKTPNETGILGNEFFARDLYEHNEKIVGLEDYPLGMVTLDADGGAFRPREGMLASPRFALKYAIPSEFLEAKYTERLKLSAPMAALKADPLWSDLGNIVGGKYQTNDNSDENCENTAYECRTVTIFNQYPKGADQWSTASGIWRLIYDAIRTMGDSAKLLDEAAKDRAVSFINNYFKNKRADSKRKRFPAVFSVYLAGLDHDAHLKGMGNGEYLKFFNTSTDPRVADIVKALKDQDEFDNKIFIVVADHGHTQMPENLTYPAKVKTLGSADSTSTMRAEMSCELKLDFAEPEATDDVNNQVYDAYNRKEAERNNNNLHIWELGEMFEAIGGIEGAPIRTKYKLLAPGEIEDISINNGVPDEYSSTSDIDEADIVAALNGPMAHLYSMIGTDNKTLGEIAEAFRVMFNGSYSDEAVKWYGFSDQYNYMKFRVKHAGRLRTSVDKILIRLEDDKYYVFGGLNDNGNPITYSLASSLPGLDYVDGENRVNGMNNKNRSGDLVLIMKDDVYLPENESISDHRFTTGVACKSWHGSLNRSDSYVPFIITYPGGNSSELEQILKKDTLCKSDYSACKANWKLPDIVKEVISTQYQ